MDEAVNNEDTKYSSIKQNPKALLKLVNTYVRVQLIKDCAYVGFVHSIDPVTNSIILSVPQDNGYQTIIVPGHAVLDITQEELLDHIKPPQKKESHADTPEEILKRKAKLISWFKTNLLPVTELDDKIIIGNVTLLRPYKISDISADNPIVAMQIKNVIESMPENFQPK
ncbi:hypothetical protein SFRURICE_001268 [Spodoptera frugiperda]|uniref:SFRICE_025705 n=1 Tax=Spodoptera frugiperda TaxID=7108 RepID=A0A2H1VKA0_SPOFR|nr:hypothetical protein SFRURICE_001268 [Spodoptera frugiperda]